MDIIGSDLPLFNVIVFGIHVFAYIKMENGQMEKKQETVAQRIKQRGPYIP